MPRREICVTSPEVAMHGEINIHARVAVVTKAKLDDIRIGGECLCGPAPQPKPEYDVLVLIDGSDSYNNKVSINGEIDAGDAFEATQEIIDSDLIPGLQQKLGDRATFRLLQFSGIKQLEGAYKPGSGGAAGTSGLLHYKEEVAKTSLDRATRQSYSEGLDGNGQLFLVLQDLNLEYQKTSRNQILVIVSDEEWDLKKLQTPSGRVADRDEIATETASKFATYPVIVRPNELADLDDDFIANTLASRQSNYKKVFTKSFDKQLKKAFKEIIADLE
ncbi:Oidioi.mRNA.OKI2018_I69.PAR.g8652.t1.cds [Oikopleura dioica]|uniref:Oidioi.mRNA.OKI2018_I69.PAR.g8652.t1.cds n=1 Tax=Oikopleura dioica TaxID=34765 RepID=A0ABN7RPG4_OIKDI|nr:Oidioi.mRNA.OKI2018_I69.PAR.g8652.t1.cds [Oikopleura dioica]